MIVIYDRPGMQDEQCCFFILVVEHWTSNITLQGYWKGGGICPTSLPVFSRSDEGFLSCPLRCPVGGAPCILSYAPQTQPTLKFLFL